MLVPALLLVVILGVLIFIHELGHFLIAKKSGIRVDEFAIGFPPKLWGFKKGDTTYSLNLIPFGGYVKIFGETVDDEALDPNRPDSFLQKSKLTQASVLIGGVLFNVLFGFILLTCSLMAGFPTVITDENSANMKDVSVVITGVLPESPAKEAGIEAGDYILSVTKGGMNISGDAITVSAVQEVIASPAADVVTISLRRAGVEREVVVHTADGLVAGKPAIGISMDRIGTLQLPFWRAIGEGFVLTGQTLKEITIGLVGLITTALSGNGSLDTVAGPVGIVSLVDSASNFGFYYLLTFTAFISLNLAVLNILPLPALDGGRLLVILIEVISRRSLKPSIVNWVNAAGFALLILFMIVVTINDILRLV